MAGPAWELFVMWPHVSHPRSYGRLATRVQRLAALALVTFVCALAPAGARAAAERPGKIFLLCASLSAGFGLRAVAAFPARLAHALTAKGIAANPEKMPEMPNSAISAI